MIDECFTKVEALLGTKAACTAIGRARATHYRHRRPPRVTPKKPRPSPPNKLGTAEVQLVLSTLNSERFVDCSPTQAYYVLLDEGTYIASISSFYRALRAAGLVRERRRQASHPARVRPELVAHGPNEVWSWDITKLKGPEKGLYYNLYVVLDIFSRKVVAWLVARAESGDLAKVLIEDAIARHQVQPAKLSVHADNGSSMTSHPVLQLYEFLGISRSHSRPHVSNDNPYSESQFKTLKYWPAFPERFGSLEDAKAFCEVFFEYYDHEHRHSGIAYHTPASVHYGTATEVREKRAETLQAAYDANPARFRHRKPQPPKLPTVAWINPPIEPSEEPAQIAS